jgi:hypothetical protein
VPDWLAGEDRTPAPAQPGGDMPDWLGESEAPQRTGDSGLPAWLHGAEDDIAPPAPPAEPPPDAGAGFGSWFDEEPASTLPEAPGQTPPVTAKKAESSEFFGGAELPSWLVPGESETAADTAESRKVSWLSNLVVQEDEELEQEIAPPPPVEIPRPTFTRSAARIEATQLLQQLAASPYPQRVAQEETATPTMLQKIGLDRILYTALILVLLISLFFPALTGIFRNEATLTVPNASNNGDLFEQIESIQEKDIVLLAYEWDTQRRGELADLERVVTDHLIDRKAHIIVVSTDIQGTMLSFDLRDRMRAAGYYGQGVDYILLGYRPGGELALRTLAQDFRSVLRSDFAGRDATQGALATDLDTLEPRLTSIHDLSMIVVVANQSQDVQGWVEQVHRITGPSGIPMGLLLPSEVAPVARPYLQQPHIYSLVGKQGALSYMKQLDAPAQPGVNQPEQISGHYYFSILVFLLLAGAGIAVNTVTKGKFATTPARPPFKPKKVVAAQTPAKKQAQEKTASDKSGKKGAVEKSASKQKSQPAKGKKGGTEKPASKQKPQPAKGKKGKAKRGG